MGMQDKEPYTQILGIRSPWQVVDIELSVEAGEVKVHIEPEPVAVHHCPKCVAVSPGYDRRRRQSPHLDTCQFRAILVADAHRVECSEMVL
jgi:transposase